MSDASEAAVAAYFAYLENPDSLVNSDEVADLQRRIDAETSLMNKALLISELERARDGDPTPLVEGFVTHGRKWAAAAGVTATALRQINVPSDVLARAGIGSDRRRGRRPSTGGTRKAVPARVVRDHVLERDGEFTYAQVVADTGSSMMTVRKVIDNLVIEGGLERVEAQERWDGPGRAPFVFKST